MKKIWLKKFEEVPEDFLREFKDYPLPILQIFWLRNLRDENSIKKFLFPKWEDQYDPFLLKGVKEASQEIAKAIKNNERIGIFGDFDVDGVSATSLFHDFFNRLNFNNFEVALPNYKDSYGLSLPAVKKFKERKTNLIITVDCGITSNEVIKAAKNLSLKVIVTDHHLPQENLPPAFSIVDPLLEGDKYPFKFLSGTGVAFKLIEGVASQLDWPFKESFAKWSADLLALANVADFVPLKDENRIMTKFGLITLEKTRRVGLEKLKKSANLEGKITSRDIAFSLAPRLNIAPRIDDVNAAYQLLVTESESEAEWIVEKLERGYHDWRETFNKAYQTVVSQIKEPLPKVLTFGSSGWKKGVVRTLSTRLREEFFRPVFLWQENLLEVRGSARSIDKFNLVEVMEKISQKNKDIFINFGGHAKAAGFSLKPAYLKYFLEEINKYAEKLLKPEDLIPKIEIEANLKPEDINSQFIHYYELLEPFGIENQEPVFLAEGVIVKKVSLVGNNDTHLKLRVQWQNSFFEVIGFGQGKDWLNIKEDDKLDIVFNLRKNSYRGRETIDFYLLDWRKRE